MNKRSKARWVRNLRDPKYADRQCRGILMSTFDYDRYKVKDPSNFKFCALGVLIDGFHRSLRNPTTDWWLDKSKPSTIHIRKYQPIDMAEVYSSVGLATHEIRKIIELNDVRKWTFPKIADYIEKNF
jgi:hypothetical protein